MKTILIAVPTARYIETRTFKCIYDLKIPAGYQTTFKTFTGDQVDQVRNDIAALAVYYDYLFAVDGDMAFPPDTLERLLSHNKPIVSGLYIQRKPGEHILEIYRNGKNVPLAEIEHSPLVEVDGCGFGCVLVKSEVLRAVGYPQFVYKPALDHRFTVSEDTYFCARAKEHGYGTWADTTIRCEHIGQSSFFV
jgi:GT2 family glycosyltransferase